MTIEFKKIGIIGLGYVGIPLALRLHEVGLTVLGFDIDEPKTRELNQGISSIAHISSQSIANMVSQGFEATVDFSRAGEVDALIICVPTPLDNHREPDLSYVVNTMESLVPHIRAQQMLSLESTTYPRTTEEILRPMVEGRGFTIGQDFFLVYSPEREDPGNENFSTQTIPKVVGGSTPACLEVGMDLYGRIVDKPVPVSSTATAEMVKLLENIHRAVNIGLVNELKIVADKMGIDIYEVIQAAASKPFGFTPYYPGPGLGGHCIPIDPFYLTWKAREYGVHTRFIELAGEVNDSMPQYVVGKVFEGLNRNQKSVNGAKVLALGIAYKRDVDDMRESPSIEVMKLLRDLGADVAYSDPYVASFPPSRKASFDLDHTELTPATLASYDVVVILTDHRNVDYAMVLEHAQLIVDSRGIFREPQSKVINA